ncbi:HAD-IC family P-type ATPase [Chitinophaga silvisoli]|uniref:HAD-IC family P-type ATPase n=1 Tax=Chitinophaga silvisoli TaxID=2291814 RepID=UPI0018F26E4E|nr:HAD-IC family P-type ATPase [Chitinophaga silvisoli]
MNGPLSDNFYHLPVGEVFKALSASAEGLSNEEAVLRLKKRGNGSLKNNELVSSLNLFISQFKSPVTILLIIAAFLSMGLRDIIDAGIILFIILVSCVLSFWQEKGANHAVSQLLKIVQIKCRLIRNGKETDIAAEEVVPGDIILLKAGDIIPGDSLLLSSAALYTDEAAFTGETFPVEKIAGQIAPDALLSRRSNTLFMGSHVISGNGKAIIVITGKETRFGRISEQLKSKPPETGFESGVEQLGYMLMEITLLLVMIIFGINILLHRPALDSMLFSLALAVGLTPQLLPAIITINLSAGAREMARNKVIVKRLSSIDNLGSMNMLCADKTGTITAGKVTLKDALDAEGNHSEKVLHYAWLNATLQRGYVNPVDQAIQSSYKGDAGEYKAQAEIAYDFSRKRLSVQVRHQGDNFVVTKGALNAIIDLCSQVELPGGGVLPMQERLPLIRE